MTSPVRSFRRLPALLLGSTMLMGSAAWAQDAQSPAPVPTQEAPAGTTAQDDPNTVVVTATRREENLQDVPIAITALTT
ncbi:MAG TPA: hypothetical protein VHM21_01615, partial [Sphingomicrobium sp.]|nr:hypothetical protein [Sphingomicrobium sp.]